MLGESEAILILPPGGVGVSDDLQAVTNVAFTGTSTSAQALPSFGLDIAGCFVAFKADQDCRIRVGTAGVGAAIATDYLLKAYEEKSWWCSRNTRTHVRVIRDTTSGTLQIYRNG